MSLHRLEDLEVYILSEKLGDEIWDVVIAWDYFIRDTIGKQLTRSADSISANIAEGYGRYHYKENRNFCYFSRGSIIETKSWLQKAKNRDLITEDKFDSLFNQPETIHIKLNAYMKFIGKTSASAKTNELMN